MSTKHLILPRRHREQGAGILLRKRVTAIRISFIRSKDDGGFRGIARMYKKKGNLLLGRTSKIEEGDSVTIP
jgi:hypothetical protein